MTLCNEGYMRMRNLIVSFEIWIQILTIFYCHQIKEFRVIFRMLF